MTLGQNYKNYKLHYVKLVMLTVLVDAEIR